MKKKRILFVIDSLACAGAEKSLVTLLSLLDYTRYEVDLQLFAYGREFEQFLPKEVNLLAPFDYSNFLQKNIFAQILSLDFKKFFARLSYSLSIRKSGLLHTDIAVIYWQKVSKCIKKSNQHYDVAIGYGQGVPTFYVADKVDAEKKCAWINAVYRIKDCRKNFILGIYRKIDVIVPVSQTAQDVFVDMFPEFSHKMFIINDLINANFINKMSVLKKEYSLKTDKPILLTVARLDNGHKGYDIAINAAKILYDRGVQFRWYAIGRGDFRLTMELFIEKNNLQDSFILLGTTPNPYPYYKSTTIYVQTSRHEGFGLSIAEARILNIPVVTTEFDAVYNQMIPEENGLVVPQDPVAVADAIERLLTDKKLYQHIVSFLKTEKKGNTEELEKFYALIEG